MRVLFAVSALGLALTGCGSAKDSDSTTTGSTGTPTGWVTGSGGSGTNTGTATGSGGSGSGGSGTSTPTTSLYIGDADLDLDAMTWTGTESVRVVSLTSGTILCQWSWTALDWASDPSVSTMPEPAVAACQDGDGNACLFDFTVNLSNGLQTDGACSSFGYAADGGTYHYGYIDDWMNGGSSYGSQIAYYLPTGSASGTWFPAQQYGAATWSPGTGNQGQFHYEIEKVLLNSYIP